MSAAKSFLPAAALPLFPLQTVLFPDGLLELKIFETRYLDLMSRCMREQAPFGVVALRFVFERTLEKLGLTHEVIRRGARADLMSPYRHWTDEERAVVDREIGAAYDDFVALVAAGRKKPAEQIEPLARGRVYSGADALAVGVRGEVEPHLALGQGAGRAVLVVPS